MRSFILFLLLFIIIGVGLYLKHTGIIFSNNKELHNNIEVDTLSDTVANEITYDTTYVAPIEVTPKIKTEFESKIELRKFLLGKWEYRLLDSSAVSKQIYSGNIEYKSDGTFFQYVTVLNYLTKCTEPVAIYGGSISGMWSIINKNYWQNDSIECDITRSFVINQAAETAYGDPNIEPCDYFESNRYGDFQWKDTETSIDEITETSILISGKNYLKGSHISITFTKIS